MARLGFLIVRATVVLVGYLFITGVTFAHPGHGEPTTDYITPTLFLAGLCLLGASVFLERAYEFDRRVIDLGFFTGLASVLGAVVVYTI